MKIYKYQLSAVEKQNILMPKDARILKVDVQHGYIYVWALVDPNDQIDDRWFVMKGTGHEIWEDVGKLLYLGTVQRLDGDLVWHIFEEIAA